MKVCSIEISNTFGIGEVPFKVGPFTVLRLVGRNGTGKSSVLRSLAYILGGGCDPTVIHKGSDKSVVEVAFDDGHVAKKTTRAKRDKKTGAISGYIAELEITAPDGSIRPAPQTLISEWATALSADPTTLLRIDTTTAPGRKLLASELLKLVPLEFAPEDIQRACAYRATVDSTSPDTIAVAALPMAPVGIDALKTIKDTATEARRRIGLTRDDAEGAATRLRASLPASDGTDWTVAVREAEEYRRKVEGALADAKLEFEKRKAESIQVAQGILHAAQSEATRIYNEAVKKAADEFATAKQQADDEYLASIRDLDTESKPVLDAAISDLETKKASRDAELRATSLKQEIQRNVTLFKQSAFTYDRLSEVLQRLEDMRLEKLRNLPVSGLLVENGEASLDGIPWNNVNRARMVQAVLEICAANAGKWPIILIDDQEHMDGDTKNEINQGLIDGGYQIVCAEVSDEPLRIEVIQ